MLALGLLVISQSTQPSDADWAWLEEHRERAFDVLMPIATAPGQLLAYRRHRDLYQDVPEAHFTIGIAERAVSSAAKLRAVVTVPTSGSIQQQVACAVGGRHTQGTSGMQDRLAAASQPR